MEEEVSDDIEIDGPKPNENYRIARQGTFTVL